MPKYLFDPWVNRLSQVSGSPVIFGSNHQILDQSRRSGKVLTRSNTTVIKNSRFNHQDSTTNSKSNYKSMKKKEKETNKKTSSSSKISKRIVLLEIRDILLKLVNTL